MPDRVDRDPRAYVTTIFHQLCYEFHIFSKTSCGKLVRLDVLSKNIESGTMTSYFMIHDFLLYSLLVSASGFARIPL